MASSGMLHRVSLVRTDVSEELSACFIRVTRIIVLGIMLVTASVCSQFTDSCHPDEGGAKFLEMSVLTRATRHNIPEDVIFQDNVGLRGCQHLDISRGLLKIIIPTLVWKN
jgi:hypothetical protein